MLKTTPPVPVSRPLLPSYGNLEPYLRRIDAARYYSNHGAMWMDLRARLAAHFGIGAEHLTLASSGTAALTGAILAKRSPNSAGPPYSTAAIRAGAQRSILSSSGGGHECSRMIATISATMK